RAKGPAMRLGIPALAGLSVLHGFIPPHPGPLAAIGILHANVGITLAIGLIVAIPCVIIAGPLFGQLAARWVPIGAAGAALAVTGGTRNQATQTTVDPERRAQDPDATGTPSFALTLVTLLSPLVLML
ncbi:MAG TPA: gluconate transporter, partial [Microbacteriaceae bacterium]|nr:gluconate transporter [Microbacteriaceae bacterium]